MVTRSLPRLSAAFAVLAFFAWLWSRGAIAPGSLGWLRLVPLFLLGFIAYEMLAQAGETALNARRRETQAP